MSTDYDVYCVRCDERLGLDQGREESCAALIATAPWLVRYQAAAADPPKGMSITLLFEVWRVVDPLWFVAHDGHDLAVRDEYGRVGPVLSQRAVVTGIEAEVRAAVLAERGACMVDMLAAAEAAAKGRR